MGKRGPQPVKASRLATITPQYAEAFEMLKTWLVGEAKDYQETKGKISAIVKFGEPDEVIHDFGATIMEFDPYRKGSIAKYVITNSSQRERVFARHRGQVFFDQMLGKYPKGWMFVSDLKEEFDEERFAHRVSHYGFPLHWTYVMRAFTDNGWYVQDTDEGEIVLPLGFEAGPNWEERKQDLLALMFDLELYRSESLSARYLCRQSFDAAFPDLKPQEFTWAWEEAVEIEQKIMAEIARS